MFEIDTNPILADRAKTSYEVLHVAGLHADKYDSIPEGLLTLLFALVFAAKQYNIKPAGLNASIRSVRTMIERAQKFCGEEAGIAECVIEVGLN